MKRLLTWLVYHWYYFIGYGSSVKRELLPNLRQESIVVDDSTIVFESRLVKYTVIVEAWWWPNKTFYSILMNVRRLVDLEKSEHVGTTEYPMFLSRCLCDGRMAHVLARKQFINDISDIINIGDESK